MSTKTYLIADIRVHDPQGFAAYREQVPEVVARFGGRYLVRGGAMHDLEGEASFVRLTIIEFPSRDAARTFYDSPDYAPLRTLRERAATSTMTLVEGVAD